MAPAIVSIPRCVPCTTAVTTWAYCSPVVGRSKRPGSGAASRRREAGQLARRCTGPAQSQPRRRNRILPKKLAAANATRGTQARKKAVVHGPKEIGAPVDGIPRNAKALTPQHKDLEAGTWARDS